jgi:hypothetical protein
MTHPLFSYEFSKLMYGSPTETPFYSSIPARFNPAILRIFPTDFKEIAPFGVSGKDFQPTLSEFAESNLRETEKAIFRSPRATSCPSSLKERRF